MFEVPNAKRIRRDDVHSRASSSPSRSPSPSPSTEPEPDQDGHERLRKLLNLDTTALFGDTETGAHTPTKQSERNKPDEKEEKEGEEQEFEFRLFSATKPKPNSEPGQADTKEKTSDKTNTGTGTGTGTGPDTQKLRIRIRSPTPGPIDPGEGRFVRPFRGWEYYFTTPELLFGSVSSSSPSSTQTEKRKQFEDAAVTEADMERMKNQAWPGCYFPWRVIHLKRERARLPENKSKAVYLIDGAERDPKSRKKPGKKRRVQLRKRAVVAERAKETDVEKRNRKNRERKIKRRQKAREMKAAAGRGESGTHAEVDASSEGDE